MAPRSGHVARGTTAALWLALLVASSAMACGPIEYVSQVTRKASASVAAAKSVDADRYAPYYFTLAVEYLHKAREEAAAADFQAANRFGRKADEAATTAKQVAIERAGQPIEKYHPNMDDEEGGSGSGVAPLVEPAAVEAEGDGEESSDAVPAEPDADVEDILDEDEMPPGLGGDQ